MTRNIGDNSHGNRNELNFVNALNNKYFKDLNINLKEFIRYICKSKNININENLFIKSEYEPNSKLKQDAYIYINQHKFNISLKMGTGNSVHQEKCNDFIEFIKNNCLNVNEEICNTWKFFIWADGTLDGTGSLEKNEKGKIISRFKSSEFKSLYPEKRLLLQNFLNENERILIERFVFVGKYNSKVDFIYHGTPLSGSWISKETVLDFHANNKNKKSKSCLSVGRMSIQVWNVSQEGNTEHKRGEIQVKYNSMVSDFSNLMVSEKINPSTFEGDFQEFNLCKFLNKNKNHTMWNTIFPSCKDFKNYYLVKVTKKPLSKLSEKSVFPKADAYVINAEIPHSYLLENEYLLTEDIICNFKFEPIINTGISIKLKDSTNYTIQKFTKNSFIKAFNNYINNINYVLFSLLIYSNEKEITKNFKIAKDLNIDYKKFLNYMNSILETKLDFSNTPYKDKAYFDRIRKWGQQITIDAINNNKDLAESIFTGKNWFDDIYYAPYIFVHGDLIRNTVTEFSITTGSGRSKGKYSIEIKPK